MLKSELLDHGYRVLPDSLLSMELRMHESELAVFLLDETYDHRTLELMEAIAGRHERPWVVWESPAVPAGPRVNLGVRSQGSGHGPPGGEVG
jgi:hypothetical protein